ncbi:hypothetical protein M5K25_020164 [Dendrobium thyrsiflorum]|uniref:DUF4283 domain-containing protein n=1 Tax=Dendrobium thyrsiflorum TaxID=117978 RepID=A0ABD0UG07_DENTH
MAAPSSSNPWGNTIEPVPGKQKGFFSLDEEGKKSPSRSFKDVVSSSTFAGETLSPLTLSVFKGVSVVLLSDDEVLKLTFPFQFTLVGKFFMRRPNMDYVRHFFRNLKLSSFYSIGLLDSRHVAIQLSNDLNYSRVFARRYYYISNCQMRLLNWMLFLDIREESPIVPIWISFTNLRLHFFNPRVLHALGSIFGMPLQTDQATTSKTRPSVARVLVKFEKVPEFYTHCKVHGHAMSDCFILHPILKKSSSPSAMDVGSTPTEQVPDVNVNDNALIHLDPEVPTSINEQKGEEDSMNLVQPHILDEVEKDNSLLESGALTNDECEEGEFPPKYNMGHNAMDQKSFYVNVESSSSSHEDSDSKLNDDDGFTKIDKKKGSLWNVRGIIGVDSKDKVRNLHIVHNIHVLVLIEPFISPDKYNIIAFRLDFSMKSANCSNKIRIM